MARIGTGVPRPKRRRVTGLTASDRLCRAVPVASPGDTVGQTISSVLTAPKKWDSLTYIFVVDEQQKPTGIVDIEDLIAAEPGTALQDIMIPVPVTLPNTADQEDVARAAIRHELDAVPVVDMQGRLLGAVDHNEILDVLHAEHAEDALRGGGIRVTGAVSELMQAGAGHLVRLRLPWLLLGLAGGMLATMIVGRFEAILERELALAFFIPVIVYMADAVGTQTETVFIRSMAFNHLRVGRYLLRESAVGVVLGLSCALPIGVFALLWFGSAKVAVIVGLAMLAGIMTATFVAVMIPLLLTRLGKDPALGSGPFATIVQDVLSILIYFAIASLVLVE